MIKKKADYNYEVLDFVIAKIYYNKKQKKFKFDKNYNARMKTKHVKILQQIENSQLVVKE